MYKLKLFCYIQPGNYFGVNQNSYCNQGKKKKKTFNPNYLIKTMIFLKLRYPLYLWFILIFFFYFSFNDTNTTYRLHSLP